MPSASKAEVRFHALYPGPAGETPDPQYWQQLRVVLVAALDDHIRGRRHLDSEIARFLQEKLRDINQGEVAELFEPRKTTGGRGNLRRVRGQAQVEAAVDYMVAADLGVVMDRRSRTTVSKAFGVCREQVYRWMRAAGPPVQRTSHFNKRWVELQARSVKGMLPRMLTKLMKIHARQYRLDRRTARSRR